MKRMVLLGLGVLASLAITQNAVSAEKGFTTILGDDLTGWMDAKGNKLDARKKIEKKGRTVWKVEDATLIRKGKGCKMVWTQKRYGDFILDLEVKTKGNSGIFFRTDNFRNPVQTGIELQILKNGGPDNKNGFAAFYDLKAPLKEVSCGSNKWRHITLTCKDNIIELELDGELVNKMDVNKWGRSHRNPDGSKNKFDRPIKELKREGHIGFQEHKSDVWYRNIRIKKLD